MGFEGGGSYLGAIAGIVAGIGNFVAHFFGITAKEILKLIVYLKDHIVALSQALLNGVLKLGRALARTVVSLLRLAGRAIKTLALWADKKFRLLEAYLKSKFKPVLEWLRKVKLHLDDFYKKYIRPVIDTIEWIRKFNQLLKLFHLDVLGKLDSVLAKIEQKIEDPFLYVRSRLTLVENWINRIVTLDGLFQRLTLIRSMSAYAPNWINGLWNSSIDVGVLQANDYKAGLEVPIVPAASYGVELAAYVNGDGGAFAALGDELADVLRQAAGL